MICIGDFVSVDYTEIETLINDDRYRSAKRVQNTFKDNVHNRIKLEGLWFDVTDVTKHYTREKFPEMYL